MRTEQTVLDETVLSLTQLQAALGKDFLTDQMLATLVARGLEPGSVVKRARNVFAQALRTRTLGPMLGKWGLFEHPAGFWIWLKLGDSVSNAILRGGYDHAITEIVRSYLRPGGIFLDVGANVGWYTLVAASFYAAAGGRVLSFEPQKELHDHLARSVHQNGYADFVGLQNVALGDREDAIQMQDAGLNSGGSFVVPTERRRETFENARMIRFDDVAPASGRVDAIKLDIEGAEPMFFKGAARFIAQTRPPIVSEINVRKLVNVSGVPAAEYVRSVMALGYSVSTIKSTGGLAPLDWRDTEDERLAFNVLFTPE